MARLRAPSSYLNRPSFARAKVGSHLIVVARVLGQNASKVLFVEHDHMVGALASRRPDQAFDMAVLPGRTEGRRPIPNAHRPDARLERGAERSVIVPNEILRRRIPRKRLGDLLRQPLSCRMAGHRKP